MRKTVLFCLLLWLSLPAAGTDYAVHARTAMSVVRIVARIPNSNSMSFGSGVVLPDGRIVTNCHVIPGDQRVMVLEGGASTEFERAEGDLAADLCILRGVVQGAMPARITTAHALKVGDEVLAIGFGGGGARTISTGRVTALYSYRNGKVIQTTAAFRQGASGGGLFDSKGNLVGVTTFFRRSTRDPAFFAIPVEWIDALPLSALASQPGARPFWMRPNADQPLFLQVAGFEADGNWQEMEAAARLWTREEPGQSQSWEALGRALTAKGELEEGNTAKERARQAADVAPVR